MKEKFYVTTPIYYPSGKFHIGTAYTAVSYTHLEKNSIMIAENLIKVKGFEDLIIFVNGENVSIIVKADKLEEKDIAQIQNIITRELGASVENINISNK